ncbi:hypothetical protein A3I48_03670 [Candidatus Daviesbacteria bacterium RIFCSPLOWO2_02_FULL_36_7]|uniref:Uncharacterized protein n=1 Tax=Candidatus Daviesbacteria bacterium RIFCSPLOWO2_02_FULL_36_7 TaxID=1797792 RepID=A0A1F5MG24_9BACT|nr:MAG: hypothetical protein A3I48_03670 [Candidatus Daviesbacteria bacterium RIFCSPLOWO2_02_FULL_36_7]
MSTQEIVNIILVIGFLIIVSCVAFATYFLIKALKTVTTLAESLEEINQSIKEKIQMKALAVIPPLLVGLISRIFKKRG